MNLRLTSLLLILCMLAGSLVLAATIEPSPSPAAAAGSSAVIVELEGEINQYTYDDLVRRVNEARQMGAKVIILEIDSYGGAVTSGLETSRFIKQHDIPIIAFVRNKAISAGSMIAVSCREIWVSPHCLIGDCAPILVGPGGLVSMSPTERAKMESPIVEDFRDSARKNGYNPQLLEAMVVLDKEVYWVKNGTGEKRIVDADGYQKLGKDGGWEPVRPERNPIDSKDSLLTLSGELASELGLARGTATTADEVAAKNGWTVVGRLNRTAGDKLIALLSGSEVRSLLMTGLVIAIFMAVKMPGTGLPEAAVAICLVILLGVPLMTGYAQWWQILLVLLGLVLIALEIFVAPGTMLPGIAGATCVLLGLLMTFVPREPWNPNILPSLQGTRDALQHGIIAIALSLTAGLVISALIASKLPKMPLFGRLVLTKTVAGGTADGEVTIQSADAVAAVANVAVGEEGSALTELRPGGQAHFGNTSGGESRVADVLCDSGFVSPGGKVRVVEIRGSTVVVRAV